MKENKKIKEIINVIEEYNEVSLALDCEGQNFKEDGKNRASKKIQALYLEIAPYIDFYKIIPERERQTIKVIIDNRDEYNKSPFIYMSTLCKRVELRSRENGDTIIIEANKTFSDYDYKWFCIKDDIIQNMDVLNVAKLFQDEIIKSIKIAIKSKKSSLAEIEKSLAAFDSEDDQTILYKQLYELFDLEKEYREIRDEFRLSLVLNQIEKIKKLIRGGDKDMTIDYKNKLYYLNTVLDPYFDEYFNEGGLDNVILNMKNKYGKTVFIQKAPHQIIPYLKVVESNLYIPLNIDRDLTDYEQAEFTKYEILQDIDIEDLKHQCKMYVYKMKNN